MEKTFSSSLQSKFFDTSFTYKKPIVLDHVQPFRGAFNDNPSKTSKNFRVHESGELRVVNKAAKRHWDYSRDNKESVR